MIFQQRFNQYKQYFEDVLEGAISDYCNEDNTLFSAIKYSIIDAGKRVRPVLCYAVNEMLGGKKERVNKFALAIEMIHTYSLVHDDLPCMDNDDYRRGKLSTHKKFTENIGVLTGDALLNLAFELALSSKLDDDEIFALSLLAKCAGAKGMIKGQVLDLENEGNKHASEKELIEIYHNKTAKLITAPILIASAVNQKKYFNELSVFAYNLGMLFQFVDDLMDVESNFIKMGKTPNKDLKVDKLTSIRVYGLEKTKEFCDEFHNKCISILNTIPNSEFLKEFTTFMLNRRN